MIKSSEDCDKIPEPVKIDPNQSSLEFCENKDEEEEEKRSHSQNSKSDNSFSGLVEIELC